MDKQLLEEKIDFCFAALQVYTEEEQPLDWARTQYDLSNAYWKLASYSENPKSEIQQAVTYSLAALRVYTEEKQPLDWAKTQNNLGIAYSNLVQYSMYPESEIKQAIASFVAALRVYAKHKQSSDWAGTQNNLGHAYRNLALFSKNPTEEIKQAITYYAESLQIYTEFEQPLYWGIIQNGLGTVYSTLSLFSENPKVEIEQAILYHLAALRVYTKAKHPQDWAMIKNNLGNAYNRLAPFSENPKLQIEQAIKSYNYALEIYTEVNNPQRWATVKNGLGAAYCYLAPFSANPELEIEKAIDAFVTLFQVYTKTRFPQNWARTQDNLSNAYRRLASVSPSPELEIKKAIVFSLNALQIYTEAKEPLDWARTQDGLGSAYSELVLFSKNPEAEIRKAIPHYLAALQVYTEAKHPQDWAIVQNGLGVAYSNLTPFSEKPEAEIKQAITFYLAALRVRTESKLPEAFAMSHNNLGNAYGDLAAFSDNPKAEVEQAILSYNASLRVYSVEMRATDCLNTGRNFGNLCFSYRMWETATEAYGRAIDGAERIRAWATDDRRREEIQEQAIEVYTNIVQAYINWDECEDRYSKALEYVERSRSRRLVELMSNKDFYNNAEIPPQVKALLEEYELKQLEINALLPFQRSDNRGLIDTFQSNRAWIKAPTEKIQQLESEKQKIWQQLRKEDPIIATQIQVDPISFSEIQSLVKDNPKAAILSFNTTATDIIIFVTTANQSQPLFFHCTSQEKIDINEWIKNEWLGKYLNTIQKWEDQMPQFLAKLSQILQLDKLINPHLQNIDEIIIIPHRYLHQIPFAALPISGKFKYLGDRFKLRYAPSPHILKFCQERGDLPFTETSQSFGTLENAREDLMFAQFEGEQLAKLFNINASDRLQGKKGATTLATKTLLKTVAAFTSCNHAVARLDNSLESMIPLGDGAITLGQLLTYRFPQLYDVFLSSCEGSLGESKTLTDDQVTLGMGFLSAGARAVISALWEIDDLAAAVFSILYHQKRKKGSDRISAIQSTAIEIREMTQLQLHEFATQYELDMYLETQLEQISASIKAINDIAKKIEPSQELGDKKNEKSDELRAKKKGLAKLMGKIQDALNNIKGINLGGNIKDPLGKPFTNPFYWAAFTCQGLG